MGTLDSLRRLSIERAKRDLMIRLIGIALLGLSMASGAWSKAPVPPSDTNSPEASQGPARSFSLSGTYSDFDDGRMSLQAEVAPNTQLGVGIYGLKSDKSHLRPATVGEIGTPRQRRAGVGLSLRF